MEKLTIKGFINEMSYKLNMEELEALVIDYQDVIIDYIIILALFLIYFQLI